eukprot:GHVS01003956.1.p1 GENE.GHVS01003956.1~~GHVS01003956.1.p1  ORF type:complete len:954 (+),score=78.54 GHVS01003956.1:575-3436(+)
MGSEEDNENDVDLDNPQIPETIRAVVSRMGTDRLRYVRSIMPQYPGRYRTNVHREFHVTVPAITPALLGNEEATEWASSSSETSGGGASDHNTTAGAHTTAVSKVKRAAAGAPPPAGDERRPGQRPRKSKRAKVEETEPGAEWKGKMRHPAHMYADTSKRVFPTNEKGSEPTTLGEPAWLLSLLLAERDCPVLGTNVHNVSSQAFAIDLIYEHDFLSHLIFGETTTSSDPPPVDQPATSPAAEPTTPKASSGVRVVPDSGFLLKWESFLSEGQLFNAKQAGNRARHSSRCLGRGKAIRDTFQKVCGDYLADVQMTDKDQLPPGVPPIDTTLLLAIVWIALLNTRHAVMSEDVLRWTRQGKIPLLRVTKNLPVWLFEAGYLVDRGRTDQGASVFQIVRIPSTIALEHATMSLRKLGVRVEPLNAHGMVARLIAKTRLPSWGVLPLTLRLLNATREAKGAGRVRANAHSPTGSLDRRLLATAQLLGAGIGGYPMHVVAAACLLVVCRLVWPVFQYHPAASPAVIPSKSSQGLTRSEGPGSRHSGLSRQSLLSRQSRLSSQRGANDNSNRMSTSLDSACDAVLLGRSRLWFSCPSFAWCCRTPRRHPNGADRGEAAGVGREFRCFDCKDSGVHKAAVNVLVHIARSDSEAAKQLYKWYGDEETEQALAKGRRYGPRAGYSGEYGGALGGLPGLTSYSKMLIRNMDFNMEMQWRGGLPALPPLLLLSLRQALEIIIKRVGPAKGESLTDEGYEIQDCALVSEDWLSFSGRLFWLFANLPTNRDLYCSIVERCRDPMWSQWTPTVPWHLPHWIHMLPAAKLNCERHLYQCLSNTPSSRHAPFDHFATSLSDTLESFHNIVQQAEPLCGLGHYETRPHQMAEGLRSDTDRFQEPPMAGIDGYMMPTFLRTSRLYRIEYQFPLPYIAVLHCISRFLGAPQLSIHQCVCAIEGFCKKWAAE